jgi:hypothetical protein
MFVDHVTPAHQLPVEYLTLQRRIPTSAPSQHTMPHLAEEPDDGNWDETFAFLMEDPDYVR